MSFRVDFRGPLGKVKVLSDGGLRIYAKLSRTGIQSYTYSDGRVVRENRPESEVFSEDSLETFRGAAVTIQHPSSKVNPTSWRALVVGHVSDNVKKDGDCVGAELYIKDAETIRQIESGDLVEISCGYDCQTIMAPGKTDSGEEFDASQAQIRINHVALGPSNWGRAGRNVRLYLDSEGSVAESAIIAYSEPNQEDSDMTDEEKKAKAEADKKAAEAKAKAETEAAEKAKAEADAKAAEEKAKASASQEAPAAPAELPAASTSPEPGQVKQPGNIDSADALKFDNAVDERLEVVANARRIVGDSFEHKGKSNAQIRREVVEAKGLKTDSKSDDYVSARFDALLETVEKQDAADGALGNLREGAQKPAVKTDKAEDARAKMIQANNEAWKTKTKPRGQK